MSETKDIGEPKWLKLWNQLIHDAEKLKTAEKEKNSKTEARNSSKSFQEMG